jgi:CRP-like cAMP-binding protein
MGSPSNWPRNRLLLALPSRNLHRLMPALEQIPCQHGQILLDADGSLEDVFFPDSGVISVVAVYEDGSIIEMATIGREGCTGFQAIFGAKESSVRFLVQIPGSAAKMSRASFTRAMASMPSFRNLMRITGAPVTESVHHRAPACHEMGAHRWLPSIRLEAHSSQTKSSCSSRRSTPLGPSSQLTFPRATARLITSLGPRSVKGYAIWRRWVSPTPNG